MNWLCWHVGTVNDPKFMVVAKRANCSRAIVIAFWAYLLEKAAEVRDQGSFGKIDPEDAAIAIDCTDATVVSMMAALEAKGLISGEKIANWVKRQHNPTSSERVRRYRDRLRSSGQSLNGYLVHRDMLDERDGGVCVYCLAAENLVIDHMVPVQQGGTHDPDNLCLACKSCNSGKAGRTPEEARLVILSPAARDAHARYMAVSRPVTGVTPTGQDRTDIHTDRQEDISAEAEFETWYSVYPLHKGRGQALRAFRSARKRTDFETLMAGAAKYVADPARTPKFTKHPATWLNGECWKDETTEAPNDKQSGDLAARREPLARAVEELLGQRPAGPAAGRSEATRGDARRDNGAVAQAGPLEHDGEILPRSVGRSSGRSRGNGAEAHAADLQIHTEASGDSRPGERGVEPPLARVAGVGAGVPGLRAAGTGADTGTTPADGVAAGGPVEKAADGRGRQNGSGAGPGYDRDRELDDTITGMAALRRGAA